MVRFRWPLVYHRRVLPLDLSHWINKLWNAMAAVYLSIDHIVQFLLSSLFAVNINNKLKYLDLHIFSIVCMYTLSTLNATSTGNKIHPKNAPKIAAPKPATAIKLTSDTPFKNENIFYLICGFAFFSFFICGFAKYHVCLIFMKNKKIIRNSNGTKDNTDCIRCSLQIDLVALPHRKQILYSSNCLQWSSFPCFSIIATVHPILIWILYTLYIVLIP